MTTTNRIRRIKSAGIHAMILAGLIGAAGAGAQGLPGWTKQKKITMNTTATGANVAGEVKAYPVAVSLTAANFDFASAKADGSDLRFTNAAGAELPFEIESWDAAGKKAAAWVKTDVKGNDKTQFLTIHWGNPAATAAGDGKKVFAKEEGWSSAWHLAEKGGDAAGYYKDAGENGANGTGVNIKGDATGEGRMGPALNLTRASKQYILIDGSAASPLYNPTPSKGTFSIWSNAKSHTGGYVAMFSKGETGFRIHYFGDGPQTEPCIDVGSYDWCPLPKGSHTNVDDNKWYHLMYVVDKPSAWYYINGKLEVTEKDEGAWKTSGNEPVAIGNNATRARSFDGRLDEARIMGVPKDANWAKLDYESQKEGSTFLTIGTVATGLGESGRTHLADYARGAAIRRFDIHGRLVATVRSTGDARADAFELARNAKPGLHFDRLLAADGSILQTRRVILP